jgi:hypothetical protein
MVMYMCTKKVKLLLNTVVTCSLMDIMLLTPPLDGSRELVTFTFWSVYPSGNSVVIDWVGDFVGLRAKLTTLKYILQVKTACGKGV